MATQNRGGKGPRAGGQRRPAPPRGPASHDSAATRGQQSSGGADGGPRRLGQQGQAAGAPRRLGQQQSNAPRRLGQPPATRPRSAGAQRRAQRSRRSSSARWGWLSVPLVVVVVLVFVLVKVTSGGSNNNSSSSAVTSGRDPAAAPASIVNQLVSTPLSVQSSAGVGTQSGSPFETLSNASSLTGPPSGGGSATSSAKVPRVVFVGAEFCPYCAIERYAVILALSRLGTFHDLKVVDSGSSDGDIPTFSFLGSSYSSRYVDFTPYETEDRNRNNLQTPPKLVLNLWNKDDTDLASGVGWPYMNFGGKYVLTDFPSGLDNTISVLDPGTSESGAGLSRGDITDAVHDPSSTYGGLIDSKAILAQANFIDGAICLLDGGKPASLCQSSGVKAAMTAITAAKPVKA